ncbi:MAG: (Fe-S)-binding protein, partial [Dehalococcoidia bacterium]|nr:(Fe-S)-binding protein [Dehalococcoidia bacterium]
CTSMMRVFYPPLFEDDPELQRQATELGSRVYELSEFLVKVLGITDVGGKYAGKVAYHPSCHLLRELEVEDEPVQLLRRVDGIDLVGVDEARTCCGFGGTFSVKYPHISEGMLEDKLENLKASGATTLVGCDVSCLMHMEGALRRRGSTITPLHLAQVLESAEE